MNNNKKGFVGGLVLGISIATIVSFCLIITIVTMFGINTFSTVAKAKTGDTNNKASLIKSTLEQLYMGEINNEAMQEGIYKGMVDSLGDPYTVYFTEQEYSKFLQDSDGSFGGIGVTVSASTADNTILVISVNEGSPAEKAGVLPGDRIIKAENTDVSGSTMDTAIDIMRGEIGTPVKVTIYRESDGSTFDLTLNRELVEVNTVSHKMLENSIGYIKLTGFEGVTYKQFTDAYNELNDLGQKGLIIDLRFNPGGQLETVVKIADLLVPEGPIVSIEEKGKAKKVRSSDANHIEIPLVMLVNGYSASASEVLTGAVKDYGVGKVVGTTTFGKGIVQTLLGLGDGSGLKVTTAKYYTPNDICIHEIGIEPDYAVELPDELKTKTNLTEEEDLQLQKAIEVLEEQIN